MKESIVIISVGQQIHRKGFDILLRAVNDIGDDIGIYILGGAPNDECQEILEVMSGTKIYFPGKVSKDKLKEYYTAADIFVFPTRYDIWGYPVNEAMSYGLPIITTMQCNAGLELIERGVNGYLVEAENINELQKYILKLIENDKLRIQIGQNNYYKSKEYNSETMANSIYSILLEYREIYEQV